MEENETPTFDKQGEGEQIEDVQEGGETEEPDMIPHEDALEDGE